MNGVRYGLRLLALRQSAVAPGLTYLAIVAGIYASDAGPAVPAGTATAVLLLPVTAWLARLLAGSESNAFADLTLLRLGGPVRRQLAWAATTVLVASVLGAVAIGWGRIANPNPYSARSVLLLAVLHLVLAVNGAALGALLSRPFPVPTGMAVLLGVAAIVASAAIRWLPPIGPILRAFAGDPASDARQIVAVLAAVGTAAVLLGLGCVLSRST